VLSWALRSLFADRGGLIASAAGVGLALLLAIVVEGVFAGEAEQIVAYPNLAGADVFAMQEGVANMHMATSFVHEARIADVEALPGVAAVGDILYVNGFLDAAGSEWFAYLVGLRDGASFGGPWAMAEGSGVPKPGDVVLPDVIAHKSGVGVGDEVSVAERPLTVIGLSAGTYSMANPVVFLHRDDLAALLDAPLSTSYLLVQLEAGAEASDVVASIAGSELGLSAMTRAAFVESDRAMAMHMGADVIALMSGVGTAVAALLVAFTVYAGVIRRRRELAVASALGAGPSAVLGAVLLQSVVVAALGYVGAVLLALALRPLLKATLPEVTVLFTAQSLLELGLLSVGVAIVAAWLPARRVATLDPAEAFSS
jgi:putative ABC transport system permease protein